MTQETCRKCGVSKHPSAFSPSVLVKGGNHQCRSCLRPAANISQKCRLDKDRDAYNAYQRAYRAANPNKFKAYRERSRPKERLKWIWFRFGLSKEEYESLVTKQGGKCAICGGPPIRANKHLDVDHNHSTGKVRGLLCSNCNIGLGMFLDSEELLDTAINYIRQGRPVEDIPHQVV